MAKEKIIQRPFYLPESKFNNFVKMCEDERLSMTKWIEQCITTALKNKENKG